MDSHKNIAIITARGGSKRIPRKNIKPFLGKPIIEYSIEAALKSNCFLEVMVSTDDREIKEIAEKAGATVPFMRSPKNSDDFSTTADVLLEVIKELSSQEKDFENLCCIYPTAPFISAEILKESHDLLIQSSIADVVLPIVRFGFPVQRALRIENGFLRMFQPKHQLTRSQDLDPGFHDAGQFYWLNIKSFLQRRLLYSENMIPFERSELEVQDIDNITDWKIAELKYQLTQR